MLELKEISKTYSDSTREVEAIKCVQMSLNKGERIALVGPSGCGKTTLLRIIAGLISASSGSVILNGKVVDNPGKDRGLIFQNPSLFPWRTVEQNISFPLELQSANEVRKSKTIEHSLAVTGLKDFSHFYPKDLSGGMGQRVAIARTLANRPEVLLMDEPFSALDFLTRTQMQSFLNDLWQIEPMTTIFVTHDIGEAIFLADTVYVAGKLPMQIKKIFKVPFERPRDGSIKRSTAFLELESRILRELET